MSVGTCNWLHSKKNSWWQIGKAHMHRFLSVCHWTIIHWTIIHISESIAFVSDYTLGKIVSANRRGIFALTGRAHCQRQVAFFYFFVLGNVSPIAHQSCYCTVGSYASLCICPSVCLSVARQKFTGIPVTWYCDLHGSRSKVTWVKVTLVKVFLEPLILADGLTSISSCFIWDMKQNKYHCGLMY